MKQKKEYIMQIGGIDDQEAVDLAEGWNNKNPNAETASKKPGNNKDDNKPDVETACIGAHGEPYP